MSAHEHPKPVGGKLLGPPMPALLALFGLAAVVMLYRFVVGVGPVSNMTDGFTWGIWEPLNVVVFTGIGAGAFSVGLLTYALNKGQYHGLVRPAVLVGAIAYTLGASSIVVALGRYWNAYWLPWVPYWNLSSALLEVAVCVIAYVTVLWIEVMPSVLEGAAASRHPRLAAIGRRWGPRLQRALPFIIALAIVLPTMHQSSLGGLMLIAETKVHPLWHTALLPALFLVSCLSMGFGAVVALVTILKLTWNGQHDQRLLAQLSKVNAGVLLFYVALRLGDVAWSGKLRYLGANFYTALFLVELALFLAPAVLFLVPAVQANRGRLFGAALLAVLAGAAYRMDTYLSVYRPAGFDATGKAIPSGWQYFPSLGETIVTVGMAAVGVAIFIVVSRLFPVVVVEERSQHSKLESGAMKTAASR
jgi:Ni/Fe-hydrogenase subunit HybB-like protein